MKTIEEASKEYAVNNYKNHTNVDLNTLYGCALDFKSGAEFMQKEYEEKLRWIPVDELKNPTIPFLCKDKFGRIELFKFTNIKSLKAVDVVEWRNIL